MDGHDRKANAQEVFFWKYFTKAPQKSIWKKK
jgi:hypothetical protein